MYLRPACLAALLAVLAQPAFAEPEPGCVNAFNSDPIRVSIGPTKIRINEKEGQGQLTAMTYSYLQDLKHAALLDAIGATSHQVDYSVKHTIGIAPSKTFGKWCYRNELQIDFAKNPVDVYIAKEYANDSCKKNAIHEHEMLHVTVYHSALRFLAKDLQQFYASYYQDGTETGFRTFAETATPMPIPEGLDARIRKQLAVIETYHKDVDNEQEYQNVGKALDLCDQAAAAIQRTPTR